MGAFAATSCGGSLCTPAPSPSWLRSLREAPLPRCETIRPGFTFVAEAGEVPFRRYSLPLLYAGLDRGGHWGLFAINWAVIVPKFRICPLRPTPGDRFSALLSAGRLALRRESSLRSAKQWNERGCINLHGCNGLPLYDAPRGLRDRDSVGGRGIAMGSAGTKTASQELTPRPSADANRRKSAMRISHERGPESGRTITLGSDVTTASRSCVTPLAWLAPLLLALALAALPG